MTAPSRPRAATHATVPPIIASAGALLARYDVIFCDVWGVVHDGHKAFPHANDALARFREKGGSVVLVSNAPVPASRVARMLDMRGVVREAWDEIVSSGAIALDHIARQGYEAVHYIGPRDRDAAFFDKTTARPVPLADAEAIVCTGLENDEHETAESYRSVLESARAKGLAFVCANPDLVVDVGGRLYPCAGALADLYEHMGGTVFWAGKPHPSAYGTAHEVANRLRGEAVPRERILAVGDAIRTDLAGAERHGVDAIFITLGIHRKDTMEGSRIVPEKLVRLFPPGTPPAIAAMAELAW